MISAGRSRMRSASAVGSVICNSEYLEYVVDSIRKIRITSSTSMNGIRLISGSSARRRRKRMSDRAARTSGGAHREAHQVRHHAFGCLLHRQRILVDQTAEVAVEHQRRDRDDQAERG